MIIGGGGGRVRRVGGEKGKEEEADEETIERKNGNTITSARERDGAFHTDIRPDSCRQSRQAITAAMQREIRARTSSCWRKKSGNLAAERERERE